MLHTIVGTLTTIAIAMYTIPCIIFFVILVVLISLHYQKRQFFVKSKMKGLEDIVGVPKHRTFNETVTGSTMIRCYEKTETYALKTFDLIDTAETLHMYNRTLWNYICTRNRFLGCVVTLSGYILAFMCAG